MNVSIRLTGSRIVMIGLAIMTLGACGGEQETASTADTQVPSIPISEPQTAYLTASGGDVVARSGVIDLEVGDPLSDGREILIAANSFADIQYGDRAIARVFGASTARVRLTAGTSEHPVMELAIDSGSASVDVSYLGPGEVWRLRTRSALYRVTGTRFSVDSVGTDELSVSEGSVQVYPSGLDVDAMLLSEAATENRVRDNALISLTNAAPVVDAGSSARLNPEAMETSNRLAAELADKLRLVEESTAATRSSLVDQLLQALRATSDSLAATVISIRAPSSELAEKLAQLEEMRLLPVPKDPGNLSLLETEELANLVKFTLRTVPQGADIRINGLWVGQSVYQGVLRASDSLTIRVSKSGYRERRIQVDRARSEVLTVQLERLPPSISTESFVKAILADDLATVRTYVREGGTVNVRTSDNIPAVVLASGIIPVLRGQTPDLSYHREILQTVVAADADLEMPFVVEGSTFKLLHATVLAGVAGFDVSELLALFTRSGADIDGTVFLEGEELTPLAIAVRWALFTGDAQEDIFRVLLEAGASLDVAINFNDELLTLREIAGQLILDGALADPDLLRLLRQAGVAS